MPKAKAAILWTGGNKHDDNNRWKDAVKGWEIQGFEDTAEQWSQPRPLTTNLWTAWVNNYRAIIIALAIVHLLFLHETGSNNPSGLISDVLKDVLSYSSLIIAYGLSFW